MVSAILANVMLYYAYRRRDVSGSMALMALMASLIVWSLTEFAHILFIDLKYILLCSKLSYLGIVTTPAFWLIFSLYYSGRERYVRRRFVAALMLLPLLTLLLVFTNDAHQLIWRNVELASDGNIFYYVKDYGAAFYAYTIYAYLLMTFGVFMIIDPFSTSFSIYKKQKVMLLMGLMIPWTANIVFITVGSSLYSIDFTPLTFVISCCALLYSFFRLGFLDIMPIAQRRILENLTYGIFVTDNQHRVVNANKMAMGLLNIRESNLIGRDLRDILPALGPLISGLFDSDGKDKSFVETMGGRYYRFSIGGLSKNEKRIGGIVTVHDVTESLKYESRIRRLNDQMGLINKILRHDISNNLTVANISLEMIATNDVELKSRALTSIKKSLDVIKKMKKLESAINDTNELKEYRVSQVFMDVLVNYDSLDYHIDGDCIVFADDAFYSVAENLIFNAMIHGKSERIDVEVRSKGDMCIIRVIDFGSSVPDEIKDKIFDFEFSHGDMKGTGYGLFLVKSVMERYGGNVSVSDNAPEGSVFTLTMVKAR